MKIYCEHGALTPEMREMQRKGCLELVHFPYDPDSRSRHIARTATPSAAQVRDLNLPIRELPGTWDDYSGSEHLAEIRQILGAAHRRDALHVDSAFKSGCSAFVTRDNGILAHKENLEALLRIRFFHPDIDREALQCFLYAAGGAA